MARSALSGSSNPPLHAPTVDRYIEVGHCLFRRMVPYRHSPTLVSLAMRLPRLEDTLSKELAVLRALRSCFDQRRIVKHKPALVGISAHFVLHALALNRCNDHVAKACNYRLRLARAALRCEASAEGAHS